MQAISIAIGKAGAAFFSQHYQVNTLEQLVNKMLGSGDLGNGITYDFSLGDSGPFYPGNDGIQMGIQGGASYQNTPFSGDTPPVLPLPAPLSDSDPHHLNLFVSNYEVDALNWAFFMAGQLNRTVQAADLPNPSVLEVKTYVPLAPSLRPYQQYTMQAQIVPNAAPTTAFQTVYQLSPSVMNALNGPLPPAVWQIMTSLQGNNYVSKGALESDLQAAGIEVQYFAVIENTAQSLGMVVTQNLRVTLTILTGTSSQPNIIFNLQRADMLANLNLGVDANQSQTIRFSFANANNFASLVSSSVPQLDSTTFQMLWEIAGEVQFEQLMGELGQFGIPLPIMAGFHFDFTNAALSIADGYVSILASVQYSS